MVQYNCRCGKVFKLEDTMVGKRVQCPSCKEQGMVARPQVFQQVPNLAQTGPFQAVGPQRRTYRRKSSGNKLFVWLGLFLIVGAATAGAVLYASAQSKAAKDEDNQIQEPTEPTLGPADRVKRTGFRNSIKSQAALVKKKTEREEYELARKAVGKLLNLYLQKAEFFGLEEEESKAFDKLIEEDESLAELMAEGSEEELEEAITTDDD